MTSPRDVLNRLKWDEGRTGLDGVRIWYRHRGAPDDEALLHGEDVLSVGQSFLDLPEGARLPMHRILRIDVDDRVEWERSTDARARGSPVR